MVFYGCLDCCGTPPPSPRPPPPPNQTLQVLWCHVLQVRTGSLPTRWGVMPMWTPAWGHPSCRHLPSRGMGQGASVSLGQLLRAVGRTATATGLRLFALPSLASSQMPTGMLLSLHQGHPVSTLLLIRGDMPPFDIFQSLQGPTGCCSLPPSLPAPYLQLPPPYFFPCPSPN